MIARCDGPVEVVYVENILNAYVGNKGDLAKIESPKERGRQSLVERACFADSQDQLYEHCRHIVIAGFCLGPKQRHSAKQRVLFRQNAKVDVPNDLSRIERAEPVAADLVFLARLL